MGSVKKTMYEVLGLSPAATSEQIEAVYQALCNMPAAPGVSVDDATNQKKVLDAAYRTLSAPLSRQAYDAFLHTRINGPTPAEQAPKPGLALVDYPAPSPQAVALRAEALSIKAEAMSLKADALMLRADVASVRASGAAAPWDDLYPLFKRVLRIAGAAFGIWFLFWLLYGMMAPRQTAQVEAQAAEKAALQEYFQTYGVRPANRAEMELMETARRRQEAERSAAERQKQHQDTENRKFEYETERAADRAERSLQEGERQAREAQRDEEERKRQAQRDEEQRQANERERLERERDRWREVLRTPSSTP